MVTPEVPEEKSSTLSQLEAQLAMLEGHPLEKPKEEDKSETVLEGSALDRSTSPQHTVLTPEDVRSVSRTPPPATELSIFEAENSETDNSVKDIAEKTQKEDEPTVFKSPEHKVKVDLIQKRLEAEQEARKSRLQRILECRSRGPWLPSEEMHRRLTDEFARRRKELRSILGPDIDGTFPYDRAVNF